MTTPFRLLALSAAALGLASCQSKQSNPDPYAATSMGGGYNPYPDQGGYATNAPAPSYAPPPSYQTPAPQPAPQPDPYAYAPPETSPPPSTTASAPKKTTTSSSTAKKKTSTASKRHTVKQGDTLYGIARSKGTTVAKLKSANGLTSDLIRPGQTLKIP